jgi:hypothetical protein
MATQEVQTAVSLKEIQSASFRKVGFGTFANNWAPDYELGVNNKNVMQEPVYTIGIQYKGNEEAISKAYKIADSWEHGCDAAFAYLHDNKRFEARIVGYTIRDAILELFVELDTRLIDPKRQ